MNLIQSMIYGLFSGISALLPISLSGHQALLNLLFGLSSPEPIRDLLVHSSIIVAVIMSSRTYFEKIRREMNRPARSRKKSHHVVGTAYYDFQLIKSAVFPMVISFFLLKLLNIPTNSFAVLSVFFLLNGLVIYITEHIPHGNKDSSMLSAFDGLLAGISSALCVCPGVSRVGAAMSCLQMRGADRNKIFHWILVLTIPVCAMLIVFDIISLFTFGIGSVGFLVFLGYLLSAAFSFAAAFGCVYLMQFLTVRTSFSVFAFYSWGAALLSFILYLNA